MIGDCNDETNFWHQFLLTDTQILRLFKAFASILLTNIKLSRAQLSRIPQLVESLGFLDSKNSLKNYENCGFKNNVNKH